MKKLFLVLAGLLLAMSVSADIDVGAFNLGSWLDANYDAVWNVTGSTIQILDRDGNLYYDFDGKTLEDFTVAPSNRGLAVSFYCVETAKRYTLIQPLTSRDIILQIEREGFEDYEVEMPFQGN
jgi:hypothetical protein